MIRHKIGIRPRPVSIHSDPNGGTLFKASRKGTLERVFV